LPLLCRALTDSSSLYLLGTHYEHTRNTCRALTGSSSLYLLGTLYEHTRNTLGTH
jgi:hypothetical protein